MIGMILLFFEGFGMFFVILWGLSQIWGPQDWLAMIGMLIGLAVEIAAIGFGLMLLEDLGAKVSGFISKLWRKA